MATIQAHKEAGGIAAPPAVYVGGDRGSEFAVPMHHVPRAERRWKIVDCEPAHLRQLSRTLRAQDAAEVRALGQRSWRMLMDMWRVSVVRRTALVDGEVAACWGVLGSMTGGEGTPWLLTSAAIERVPVAFTREARREVAAMLDIYPMLANYVHAPYRRAVAFLKILGFTIDCAEPVLPTGEYFHRFWMSRSS